MPFPVGTPVYVVGNSIADDGVNTSATILRSTSYGEIYWAAMGGKLPWKHFNYKNPGNALTNDTVIGANFAVAGATSSHLRYGDIISTTTQKHLNAVVNSEPGVVVLAIGTNQGVTDADPAVVTANLEAMIRRLVDDGGHHVVLGNIRPRDDGFGGDPEYYSARMNTVNAWIAAFSDPNVTKWDCNAALTVDGLTGVHFITGASRDNVHLWPNGAYLSGLKWPDKRSLSYALRNIFDNGNWFVDDLAATANKITNPKLTGTGGTFGAGASGTAPTSWVITNTTPSAVSCVCSVEANAITGGQNLVMDFTSTGAGVPATELYTIVGTSIDAVTAGWAIGDYVQFFAEIEVDDTASNIIGGVETITSLGSVSHRGFAPINWEHNPQAAYGGWIATDPYPIVSTGNVSVQIRIYPRSDVAGTGRVKLKGLTYYEVESPLLTFPYNGALGGGGGGDAVASMTRSIIKRLVT